MIKLSVTLLFLGLSLLAVCDGSALSSESSESSELNEMDKIERMLRKVRAQCIKNTGSDAPFNLFKMSADRAMMCIDDFDTEKFKTDFALMTNETRGAFFTEYCAKARSHVACLGRSLLGMQQCLTKATFQIAQTFLLSILEALQLACKNDGEIVFKLKDQERQECIMQKADEISTCFKMLANNENGGIDFTELTQEQCSSLTNFRQCMKDHLHFCDWSDIVGIYDIPMNATLPLTPCANVSKVF